MFFYLRQIVIACTFMIAAGAGAQSLQELEAQFQLTCSSSQLTRAPDLAPMCDMLRSTLSDLRKSQQQPTSRAPALPTPNPANGGSIVDNTTQCACNRKLGICSASARITAQEVVRVASGGLSSRVRVRTDPPAGQCVEVTVFLQETAQLATGNNRRGHPLYQVIRGPNDVEWRNVGTSASRLDYAVLSEETQCYVCDAGKGGTTGASSAADAAEANRTVRNQIRESYEQQYRDCQAGKGELVSRLDAASRAQICAGIKEAMDKQPR
jgi:hypothetical protein